MGSVRKWMSPDPLRVAGTASLASCARVFSHAGVRHLPVVGGGGRPVGLLLDCDVAGRGALVGDEGTWVAWYEGTDEPQAGDAASGQLKLLDAEAEAAEAFAFIARREADLVGILDDDERLIGVISEHDGLRWATQMLDHSHTVREASSSPVLAIDRFASAQSALHAMNARRVRHAAVLEDGRLYGVLSKRDLAAYAGSHEEATAGFVASTSPLHVARLGEALHEAAHAMLRNRVGCLPVIDGNGHVLAMLTRTDVLGVAVADAAERTLFV